MCENCERKFYCSDDCLTSDSGCHEEFCDFVAENGSTPEWDQDGLGLPGIVLYLKSIVNLESSD
jgi:hypothetical protein